MGQTILGIAILAVFFLVGIKAIQNPKPILTSLGRPATDKHVRATRIIGAVFISFPLMALMQYLRNRR